MNSRQLPLASLLAAALTSGLLLGATPILADADAKPKTKTEKTNFGGDARKV